MLFSKTTGGFYTREIHGDKIPADAVEISPLTHAALMDGQAVGKQIVADANGRPILVEKNPSAEQIAKAVDAARATAYAREADPLFFKWQRNEATKEQWMAKVEEIKTRYPDGVMPDFDAL